MIDILIEKKISPSLILGTDKGYQIAAMVIYKVRKSNLERGVDWLHEVWPVEMQLITRMSKADVENLIGLLKNQQDIIQEALNR